LDIVRADDPKHRDVTVINDPLRSVWLSVAALLALAGPARAEPWSRARIDGLPDSAFAVVETAPDGRRLRHLPHHDESSAVDPAHLAAARSRLGQVRWLDPESEAIARRHLDEHARQLNLRDQQGER
jgi:hypothetical protein